MTPERDHESEWVFNAVTGPVVAGLAAASLALTEPYLHYPALLPLGLAGAGAAATATVAMLRRKPLGMVIYRSACWLGAGAWTSLAAAGGWSWLAAGLLAGGALVAGIGAPWAAEADRQVEEALDAADRRQPLGRHLVIKQAIDTLLNLPVPGVKILTVEDWPSQAGYTVTLEFPEATGFGEEELQTIVVRLGRRLRLPPGCAPSAEEGEYQGQVVLRVPTLDDLSGDIEYPADYSPLSVNQEHALGIFADRSLVMTEVRESSTLIGGRKGGGKTNVMDVFGANLTRCPDAVIWDIDLNGGGMSVPWMVPYVREGLVAPAIDWVASTPIEALMMSEVLLAITKQRKTLYGVDAVDADSRLVPLSADCPEIVVRVDEAAEVLGETSPYSRLRDNLTEVMRLGRAVGVNLVVSTLRPIGDHVPVQVRKNCSTRIATKVEEQTELDYMFGYQRGLKAGQLKTKGEAFFFRGDEGGYSTVRKMKVFKLLPSRIADVCRATAALRPSLPAVEVALADAALQVYGETLHAVYSHRWGRLKPWLDRLVRDRITMQWVTPPPEPGAARYPSWVTAHQWADPAEPKPPASTAEAIARYEVAKRRAQDERLRDDVLGADEADIEDRFASLVSDLQRPTIAPPVTVTLAERAAQVAAIVEQAGQIQRAAIIAQLKADGVDVLDTTVSEWLKEAEARGLVRRGSKQGQWLGKEQS